MVYSRKRTGNTCMFLRPLQMMLIIELKISTGMLLTGSRQAETDSQLALTTSS